MPMSGSFTASRPLKHQISITRELTGFGYGNDTRIIHCSGVGDRSGVRQGSDCSASLGVSGKGVLMRRALIAAAIVAGLIVGVLIARQVDQYRCWSVPWWSIGGPFDGCDGPIDD